MIINLCFHGIGVCATEREPGESRYWISETVFTGVLDEVAGRPDVQLSFDDGNKSDVRVALPELVARGLRASFFALAGRLDDPASLNAAELGRLRESGMTIGSHGWAHVPWRGLDPEAGHREFVLARRVLEQASSGPVETAALPLGRYDRRVLGGLRRAGYRTVFTSDRFPALSNAWLQARYSITATDTPASVRALLSGSRIPAWALGSAKCVAKRIR